MVCYPPFNSIFFGPIDIEIFPGNKPFGAIGEQIGLVLITILWAFYTWASVALCFKASNLTNRGIVSTGPYGLIRHPAYVGKVSLWIVSALIVGSMNTLLVIVLVAVYTLRAWTEERHLSADPDYLEYKRKVPWKIPRVF